MEVSIFCIPQATVTQLLNFLNTTWSRQKQKWEQMEGEDDSARTVVCLRGRLLAERLASRNATDEAQHLGNKLMGLENMLKQEVESRNRAEKKLHLLFKKLESTNISRSSDGSGSRGQSDILEVENGNLTENVEQDSVVENFLFSEGDANSEISTDQSDICYHRFRFPGEEYGLIKGDDDKCRGDNSMALVAVGDELRDSQSIDPEILDSAVKEVLDALKLAKERLQSSIERRRINTIRVG